jgi:hypothetical protein
MKLLTLTVGEVVSVINFAILVGKSSKLAQPIYSIVAYVHIATLTFPLLVAWIVTGLLGETNNASTWCAFLTPIDLCRHVFVGQCSFYTGLFLVDCLTTLYGPPFFKLIRPLATA